MKKREEMLILVLGILMTMTPMAEAEGPFRFTMLPFSNPADATG